MARQFALTAVKLQMFGGKTFHVWHPIKHVFFISCPSLDATNGSCAGAAKKCTKMRDARAKMLFCSDKPVKAGLGRGKGEERRWRVSLMAKVVTHPKRPCLLLTVHVMIVSLAVQASLSLCP